jgi:hypothetical protein
MLGILLLHFNLASQILVGGSTGADRALNIDYLDAQDADGTPGNPYLIAVPDGGRFEFESITIPANIVVKFKRNNMNDPVYLLSTGDVNISGTVQADGQEGQRAAGGAGGPGGYDGGEPGFGGTPGAGHGPGGGRFAPGFPEPYKALAASHVTIPRDGGGAMYGAPSCFPLVGGSGGAGAPNGSGGGGGGGAILIGAETKIEIFGTVTASAGSFRSDGGYSGSGSGGCIRLVAPTVRVTGRLAANGANGNYGSYGRVRIDTIDRTGLGGVVDAYFSVGSNMVITLPRMPTIRTISAAGRTVVNGTKLFVTLTNNEPAVQDVVVDVANFPGTPACVNLDVITVPGSGAATKTTFPRRDNGPQTLPITIPQNTATSIEVYGTVCP